MPKIPELICQQLRAAQAASSTLAKFAEQAGLNLNFTLDGKFVGDVAELIATQFFDVNLHPKQRSRHDCVCTLGGESFGVQVKCRRRSGVVDIWWQPQLLLVIEIDAAWEQWSVAYNGPGEFLSTDFGFTTNPAGRLLKNGVTEGHRLKLNELRKRNERLPTNAFRVPLRTTTTVI